MVHALLLWYDSIFIFIFFSTPRRFSFFLLFVCIVYGYSCSLRSLTKWGKRSHIICVYKRKKKRLFAFAWFFILIFHCIENMYIELYSTDVNIPQYKMCYTFKCSQYFEMYFWILFFLVHLCVCHTHKIGFCWHNLNFPFFFLSLHPKSTGNFSFHRETINVNILPQSILHIHIATSIYVCLSEKRNSPRAQIFNHNECLDKERIKCVRLLVFVVTSRQ